MASPLHSNFSSPQVGSQYRTAKPLPHVLRGALAVYFEEGLYSQALNLLHSLLAAGGFSIRDSPVLPPAQYIALASTLTVHPSVTTRANSPEKVEAADLATKYLRLLHKIYGSTNANFIEAFAFKHSGSSGRLETRRRRTQEGHSPLEVKTNLDDINSELATSGGLWTRADDFWHVVGWAFNCSVRHKKRWARWELWLKFMIDVLEKDWEHRNLEEKDESLIVRYINSGDRYRGGAYQKRIIRSIFADGTPKSLSEFKEIWKDETKERKSQQSGTSSGSRKPIADINIEEDNFGEYLHSSESELEDAVADVHEEDGHGKPDSTTILPDGTLPLGGPATLHLRMRLLSLLSTISHLTQEKSFAPLGVLYDLYLSHLRPLPTPTFMTVLSPLSLRIFPPNAICTLLQFPLRNIISTSAPLPSEDDISQDLLETCYLPFAANTVSVADNAKLSICIEGLLCIFDKVETLQWSQELEDAAEIGIKAREEKAKMMKGRGRPKKGSRTEEGDEIDRIILRASAGRIRAVVKMVREREKGRGRESGEEMDTN
ncbi:MAG: hypothetical protein MMC33_006995 [Icmadophila ericetorum]|nr:hypothetical protein [Icmadophila ericetorum]